MINAGDRMDFSRGNLRVDLNPLKKQATSSKVRNVMIDFPTLFLKWYQKHVKVRFSYLLWHDNFSKGPRTLRKFPQKCQKIAGCWESAVYGSQPLIASKPDSSPPERPGLDNTTSQPWSEATRPCTTSASAYWRFVTIFLLEKTRQSTRSGGTGASCLRPWLTRGIV